MVVWCLILNVDGCGLLFRGRVSMVGGVVNFKVICVYVGVWMWVLFKCVEVFGLGMW